MGDDDWRGTIGSGTSCSKPLYLGLLLIAGLLMLVLC
jgi:hypothetical protein